MKKFELVEKFSLNKKKSLNKIPLFYGFIFKTLIHDYSE